MKLCILVITTTTTYVMLVHWSPEGDYGRNIEVPSDTNISGTVKTQVVFAIRWRSVCEPVTKLLSWSCVHVCKKCWLYGETTTSCSQWRRHLQFRGRWFLYTHFSTIQSHPCFCGCVSVCHSIFVNADKQVILANCPVLCMSTSFPINFLY